MFVGLCGTFPERDSSPPVAVRLLSYQPGLLRSRAEPERSLCAGTVLPLCSWVLSAIGKW